MAVMTNWFVGLSSATRMRSVRSAGAPTPAASTGHSRAAAGPSLVDGTSARKVEPLPGWLSTSRTPPIRSQISRQMANPRPEPPNRRVVVASACAKRSNRRARASGSIPGPVSVIAKASPSGVRSTETVTSPAVVNLTALAIRLVSTCRRRRASPSHSPSASGATLRLSERSLAAACTSKARTVAVASGPRSKGDAEISSLPAWIFERSRTSLRRPRRLWPDSRITRSRSR